MLGRVPVRPVPARHRLHRLHQVRPGTATSSSGTAPSWSSSTRPTPASPPTAPSASAHATSPLRAAARRRRRRRAGTDPGHRDPALRQGGGLPQPARPGPPRPGHARPRTDGAAASCSPSTSSSASAPTSADTSPTRTACRRQPRRATAFPSDRCVKDETYRLSPAYRDLFDDAIAYARERVAGRRPQGKREARVAWWSAIALLRSLASSPALPPPRPCAPARPPPTPRPRRRPTALGRAADQRLGRQRGAGGHGRRARAPAPTDDGRR